MTGNLVGALEGDGKYAITDFLPQKGQSLGRFQANPKAWDGDRLLETPLWLLLENTYGFGIGS